MTHRVNAIITCMTDSERPFIRTAVDSVLNQTMACGVALYVSDENDWIDSEIDGNADINLRRIPMMSTSVVRNLGVAESETDYVAFLDGDDFWLPNKIERQIDALDRSDATFAGGDHLLVDSTDKVFAYGTAQIIPMPSCWLVDREFMLDYPFDESTGATQDAKWWADTPTVSGRIRVPEFLIAYRVRDNSLSTGYSGKRKKEIASRVAKFPGMRPLLLGASYMLHSVYKSTTYAAPSS